MRIPKAVSSGALTILFFSITWSSPGWAQSGNSAHLQKIIIDTDIGDDIDDAFAVALTLRSPELQILGITTTFGDTEARAKILDRMLGEAGRTDIPVAVGIATHVPNSMSQRRYGEGRHFGR